MVRQCAWCLHLIDGDGQHVSSLPQPKLSAASHGICYVCGMLWLEEVLISSDTQASSSREENKIGGYLAMLLSKGSLQVVESLSPPSIPVHW